MKRILSALAVSGLLALGVTAIATPSSASPLSTGAATVGTVKTLAQPKDIVNIHHRRGHFGPGPVLPPWYGGPTPIYGGPGPALPPWYRRGHRHHHGGRSPWFGGPWGNPWWDDEPDYGSSSNFVLQFNVQPRPRYRAPRYTLSAAHVRWCEARYRSYRISDDSFQPYNGPRRQCVSPYD